MECSPKEKNSKHHYLFAVVFLIGAVIMAVELLGTRVLSPLYGSSLYVWSSLITVTLIALSLGYWFGGSLADRIPKWDFFYLIIFLSAVFILLVTIIAAPILKTTSTWELRIGCISSASIIFGIPLLLLGMITPFAIKLKAHELNNIGKTAGRLYAVSTVGSVAGTLTMGFLLIPSMSIKNIFYIISIVLASIAVFGWLLEKKRKLTTISLIIMAGCIIIVQGFSAKHKDMGIVYRDQSLYGQLRVVDSNDERFLLIDGVCETHLPKDTGLPVTCEYIRTFELLPYYNPSAEDVLIIGLGGGSILRLFENYGYHIDTVDINPKLEYIAKTFFHTLEKGEKFYVEDGRHFVQNYQKKYDFIIIDFALIDTFSFHLFSLEAIKEIKTHLKEGGIFAFNSVVYVRGDEILAPQSLNRTLNEVFPYVECYTAYYDAQSLVYNMIFFASMNKLTLSSVEIKESMESRRVALDKNKGIILTDGFNPLDILFAKANLEYRNKINSSFDKEIMFDFR
ncbi:MAG: fused MFS/spermidine synthase [Planctomycetota bacterium]